MPDTGTQSTCEIVWPASRLGRISACWPGPQLTAMGAAPGAAAAAVKAVDGAAATGVPELQPVAASAPIPSRAAVENRVTAVACGFCMSASWVIIPTQQTSTSVPTRTRDSSRIQGP